MLARVAALCTLLALAGPVLAADTTWDRNAAWLREQIKACADTKDEVECRRFAARALKQLFAIDDYCKSEHCMQSQNMAAQLGKDGRWSALGKGDEQTALTRAQEMATGGMPVIAVHSSGASGVIAIVMPGKLVPAHSWHRNVPVSVGTRLDKPEGSVYGKGLNFLFKDPTKVRLYAYK